MTSEQEKLFWTIHAGLPRQAPGSVSSTEKLLELANVPNTAKRVLDIGAGSGASSIVLAAHGLEVTAIDTSQLLLDELWTTAKRAGVAEKITAQNVSMFSMPYPDNAFDIVWAEGSAYIAGWEAAIQAWPRLLSKNGKLVITECCWLTDTPSEAATTFWNKNYPSMLTIEQAAEIAARNGLTVDATFIVPDEDWWSEYYDRMVERLNKLEPVEDAELEQIVTSMRSEIDLRKSHASEYGYVGFVLSQNS